MSALRAADGYGAATDRPAIVLFTAPGSCSRVPTIALEEIGVPFETRTVRFLAGEHKSADYRRHNPKGKVPALLIDGAALTENVAIIGYLNARFPEAGLLPPARDPLRARGRPPTCASALRRCTPLPPADRLCDA